MNKERFEAFTDAVIAIIMTILVLDIHLPTDDHSMRAIIAIAPSFLAYIVSFTILAVMWVNHHNLFLHVKTVNHKILYTNIFLLFTSYHSLVWFIHLLINGSLAVRCQRHCLQHFFLNGEK